MYQTIVVLVLLFRYTHTQDANCDFRTNVTLGQRYYINSLNYSPGVTCRWIGICPTGYNCRVDCQLGLPQNESCSADGVDRFLISTTGDLQLASADNYCGTGTVSAVSSGQTITAGLFASNSSPGGNVTCDLYAQRAATPTPTCNCGIRRTNRIVGGEATGVNEYPMMAAIADLFLRKIRCGGVIITNNYVLTAAHCVFRRNLRAISVLVGLYDQDRLVNPGAQLLAVTSIIIHPQYTESNRNNDMAVIRTLPMTFNQYVSPVCLPFKFVGTDLTGALLTLLGFGTTSVGGPTSRVLRKVDVTVISQASCQSSVSTLTARQFCTLTEGRGACQDDDGGPALYTDPQTGALFNIGIISIATCGSERPDVHARVASMLDFITQFAPADYCIQ